jgi:hypothetical protein
LSCRGQFTSATITGAAFAQGKIVINMNLQAGEVDVVWVSFVIFNLGNGEFAAYGAYTTISSNSSQTVDLLNSFSAPQNMFYGISAVQVDPTFTGLSVQMAIDDNFLLSYTSQMGSFMASYLFVGYPATFTCLACKSSSMSYFLSGSCVSGCDANTVPVTLSNGGQLCRSCPVGTGLIAVNGKCVCPTYYVLDGSKCVPAPNLLPGIVVQSANPLAVKPVNQPTSGVISILPDGTINQNFNFVSSPPPASSNTVTTSTVFLPSTTTQGLTSQTSSQQTTTQTNYLSTTLTIQNTQPSNAMAVCSLPNTFFNGNECVCSVGYVYSNGKCNLIQIGITVIPVSPTIPQNQTQVCSANAVFNGSACVCNSNYHLVNSNCIQCQANSQWDGIICVCNIGFFTVNGACVQRVNCPANSQDNGLGTCICTMNYSMINNTCQLIRPSCPDNSSLIGSNCVCLTGFYNISGACSKCPSVAFWSS